MLMESVLNGKGGRPRKSNLDFLRAKAWAYACAVAEANKNGGVVSMGHLSRVANAHTQKLRRSADRLTLNHSQWSRWLAGKLGVSDRMVRVLDELWPGTREVYVTGLPSKKNWDQDESIEFYVPLWAAIKGDPEEILAAWAGVPRYAWHYWRPWHLEHNPDLAWDHDLSGELWRAPQKHFESTAALDEFLLEQIIFRDRADPLVLLAAYLSIGRSSADDRVHLHTPAMSEALACWQLTLQNIWDVISLDNIPLKFRIKCATNGRGECDKCGQRDLVNSRCPNLLDPGSRNAPAHWYGKLIGLDDFEINRLLPQE